MRRYLIALLAAVAMVGGMFALAWYTGILVEDAITQGVELSLAMRVLIGLAAFWRAFWWVLLPFIFAFCFGMAGLHHLLHAARQGGKTS